jgi:endonuclease YncB( thermonuclease family)
MKKLLILITALTVSVGALAQKKQPEMKVYDFPVTRVVDGDTVEFAAPFLPAPLKPKLAVRVFGVDTPEKGFRAKCESEAKRGADATAFTKKVISESKTARVAIIDWDKFGGRVLGDIILDNNVSLRGLLIQNGFAREYYGEAKQSWCN